MSGRVEKLLIGSVKHLGEKQAENKFDQPWSTGAYKTETHEAVLLKYKGLEGDAVADTRFHGGTEKALFAYHIGHYDALSQQLGKDIPIGSNGENIVVSHMDEMNVCIEDVYQIGEAIVQVSQPRRPCWKPSRRLRMLEFGNILQRTGRTGWYFRVLQEGHIQKGDVLQLLERSYHEWTIQRMNDCLEHETSIETLQTLYNAPFLPESWKKTLMKKINNEQIDDHNRLYGPNV